MKIAFTITDCGMSANFGGDPERETHIIEFPDIYVPDAIKKEYAYRQGIHKYNNDPDNKKANRKQAIWTTIALSVVEPPEEDE